jgi:hypothetical protein
MKPFLGCLILLLAATQLLSAGPVKNNDLNLQMQECIGFAYCDFDADWTFHGAPAWGWADFSLIHEPYSFTFETGDPLSWTYGIDGYSAIFGEGGFFNIAGPDGVFAGVVTSGTAGASAYFSYVDVNYFGQWSDGEYAEGNAYLLCNNDSYGNEAILTNQAAAPAPEPSSLLLLGSGVLGMLGLRRKLY